jgi:hypothetical protein
MALIETTTVEILIKTPATVGDKIMPKGDAILAAKGMPIMPQKYLFQIYLAIAKILVSFYSPLPIEFRRE